MTEEFFKGKAALITGSSRGIGKAIAKRFARAGADVALNFRNPGGASERQGEELRAEIAALGRRVSLIQADISVKGAVKKMLERMREDFGRLDFLVLNAARAPFKPLEKLLERELRQLVDTNYLGNIFCVQEALPLLVEARGKVVFISSLGSRFYSPSYPLGSVKAAMEAAVRDLAEGLRAKGVSVNGICAGLVKTDSFKVLRQYSPELERLPEELFVDADEIADVTLFLCSPPGRGICGQTIVVDRGLGNRLDRALGDS